MTTGTPYRALWMPALAVVVPSIFIAVLAWQWVALEREAARLRSTEAATSALDALRTDLDRALAEAGARIVPVIATSRDHGARPAAWPALVGDAYLFDHAGTLVGPADLTNDSDTPEAPAERDRAAALIRDGARALQAGRPADAARSATAALDCCASARDEFGVSYAAYALWQLAVASRTDSPDARKRVVDTARALAARGVFDRAGDDVGAALLAEELSAVPTAGAFVTLVRERIAASGERRQRADIAREIARAAEREQAALAVPSVRVRAWPSDDTGAIAAVWAAPLDRRLVMVLALPALEAWILRHAGTEHSFAVATPADESRATSDPSLRLASPFPEVPGLRLAVRRPADDPAADRGRERLFIAASVAVLVLTIVAGYFALRDVVRERRMVSLRSVFLAGVTHEIKTPLTSIRLLAETLQQGRATPAASGELVATIASEAERLTTLVDNLLSTARIESGTRTYHPRRVAMQTVAASAAARFDYTLRKEGFALHQSMPDEALWVRADHEALEQAILNLLGNAVKYSGASREIGLRVERDDQGHAIVAVTDHGPGIAAADRSRIFTTFYRSADASRATTGTGLGLALVKHFTDAHGGRVTVQSEVGQGSVFTLALPLTRDVSAAAGAAGATSTLDPAGQGTLHG